MGGKRWDTSSLLARPGTLTGRACRPASTAAEVIAHLRSHRFGENRQGMKRYGIRIDRALGISHGVQRDIAKKIKRNHERAFELWKSGITEAQFIASVTADPKRFTKADARRWAAEFDSWDIVDGVSDLFVDTDYWRELIEEFADDEREFVRRTAFAMMAWSVVHRKKEPDETFVAFLPLIEAHAGTSATSSRRRSTGRCARSASATRSSTRKRLPVRNGWRRRTTAPPAGSARTRSAT